MTEYTFDFGFTAVSEEEMETTQQLETTTATLVSSQDKIDRLYNAIVPLLNNLKANPEKEYIRWPNRLAKVEEFEDHIQSIYNA